MVVTELPYHLILLCQSKYAGILTMLFCIMDRRSNAYTTYDITFVRTLGCCMRKYISPLISYSSTAWESHKNALHGYWD